MDIHCRHMLPSSGIFIVDTVMEVTMQTALAKWGNSYAIRVPANVAKELNLEVGAPLNMEVGASGLMITVAKPRYTLDELVAQMRPECQHEEYFADRPVGAEVVEWRE